MVDEKTGFDRFEDEVLEDILSATDEEILEEAHEAGEDPETYAERMREWLQAAKAETGKKRLLQAREALELDRRNSKSKITKLRAPFSIDERNVAFIPDTMAARLEKGDQSERDKKFEEEDFDELFDDDAWNDDGDG